MAGRLANTIFQGRSTDAMLVQDAYNVSTKNTNNSLYDSVKGIYSGAVDGLTTNKSSITTLANLVKSASTGTVDKVSMLNSALSAMGSSLPSLLGSLGGTMMSKLTSAAGTLIGDSAAKDVQVLYNNASLLVKAADVTDVESLTKVISELAGNSELAQMINIEAESAVIAGIAKAALDYGLPDLVDEAIAQAQSEQAIKNAYNYISSYAVSGSNLEMVNKVIDKIGLTAFLANNPDAIKSILSSYYLGTDDTESVYATRRAYLLQTLNRIDAHWREYQRNGVYIPSLIPFVGASTDAKTLLKLADPERTLVLAAANIKATASLAVIKELYPDAYFTSK